MTSNTARRKVRNNRHEVKRSLLRIPRDNIHEAGIYFECDQCGKGSYSQAGFQRFCSAACRQRDYRIRTGAQPRPTSRKQRVAMAVAALTNKHSQDHVIVCLQCGTKRDINGAQLKRRYCSNACKQAAYRARKRQQKGVE